MARAIDAGTQRFVRAVDRAWHGVLATGASPAMLPIRLALGLIFFAHGAQKIFGWFGGPGPSAAGQGFEQLGFSPGVLWAVVAGLIELLGGLLLAFGLLTRVAATVVMVEMLVAVFAVHWRFGFFLSHEPGRGHGIEYNLALIAGLLALALYGGGAFSADRTIVRAGAAQGPKSV